MHTFAPFLLAAAGSALAAPGNVCNRKPYVNLLPLSDIPAVESFCSSKFPVAPVTRGTTTKFVTSTVNGAQGTATVTRTVTTTSRVAGAAGSTVTVITTGDGATDTVTVTDAGTTTTIVTDGAGNVFKRTAPVEARDALPTNVADLIARDDSERHMAHQNIIAKREAQQGYGYGGAATTTKDAASSALARLTGGRARSIISTACSCIETPKTKKATVTRTRTSTRGGAAQATVTRTSTITRLTTLAPGATVTTTSTIGGIDATTTTTALGAAATVNACGTTQPGPADQFPILTQCGVNANNGGTIIQQSTEASWYDCFTLADNSFSTTSFTYQYSNGQCTLYNDVDNDFTTVADPDFAYSCFEQTGCGQ